MKELATGKNHHDTDYEFIKICHNLLLELYPSLKVRWVRIYGKRWAHLYGNTEPQTSLSPLKIQLNHNYGICIEDSEHLSPSELEEITLVARRLTNKFGNGSGIQKGV